MIFHEAEKNPRAFLKTKLWWWQKKASMRQGKNVSTLNQISFDSMEQFWFNYEKFSDFISSFSTRIAQISVDSGNDDRIKRFQVSEQFL